MLSKSAEYALRAVLRLAHRSGPAPVPVSELARELALPENFLSKLLHRLQKEGVVESVRGRGGGFSLGRDPAGISLAEIIRPFEPEILERRCLLGRPECRDDSPCAAHEDWLEAAGRLRRFFRETSVGDLGPVPGRGGAEGNGTPGRGPRGEATAEHFARPHWNL